MLLKGCSEPGCVRPAKAKGLCGAHHERRRTGRDLSAPLPARIGEGLAFLEQALATETDDCIDWPFGTITVGYGELWIDGQVVHAQAELCRRAHGPKPFPGARAGRTCRSRLCLNKRHVRWMAPSEIQRRWRDARRETLPC